MSISKLIFYDIFATPRFPRPSLTLFLSFQGTVALAKAFCHKCPDGKTAIAKSNRHPGDFGGSKVQTDAAKSAKLNQPLSGAFFSAGLKKLIQDVIASLYFCAKSHTITQHIIQKVEK